MAKASINFQKTKHNSVAETTREFEAHYLLPKEHRKQNEFWSCGKSDSQVFEAELQKATRKGGRVPKEENSLWEAVLNLNANHNLEDVQRVAKLIEEKFNITCSRIAVHKDEGHINERGIVEYNYHAHINFVTYKDGKQNWRREHITPQNLSQLQTDIAKELNMTRGKEGSEAIRLGHKQQRVIAKEREAKENEIVKLMSENRDLKYNFREYQQRITALENESAEDKKSLHRLNTQVKNGEATIQDLEKRLQEALQSKKSLETIKDTPKEEKIDFRASEGYAMKQLVQVQKINKELLAENAQLKEENQKLSWYKEQYQIIVKKLKEYTKFDKITEALEAVKAKFAKPEKSIFQQLEEDIKELNGGKEYTTEERKEALEAVKKPIPSLLERVEAMKAQGEKNTEAVKAFNEANKPKPSRSWQR